jgi:hypothetical protein
MIIGKFSKAESGRITGFLDTLSGDVGFTLVPPSKGAAYTVVTEPGLRSRGRLEPEEQGRRRSIAFAISSDVPNLPRGTMLLTMAWVSWSVSVEVSSSRSRWPIELRGAASPNESVSFICHHNQRAFP